MRIVLERVSVRLMCAATLLISMLSACAGSAPGGSAPYSASAEVRVAGDGSSMTRFVTSPDPSSTKKTRKGDTQTCDPVPALTKDASGFKLTQSCRKVETYAVVQQDRVKGEVFECGVEDPPYPIFVLSTLAGVATLVVANTVLDDNPANDDRNSMNAEDVSLGGWIFAGLGAAGLAATYWKQRSNSAACREPLARTAFQQGNAWVRVTLPDFQQVFLEPFNVKTQYLDRFPRGRQLPVQYGSLRLRSGRLEGPPRLAKVTWSTNPIPAEIHFRVPGSKLDRIEGRFIHFEGLSVARSLPDQRVESMVGKPASGFPVEFSLDGFDARATTDYQGRFQMVYGGKAEFSPRGRLTRDGKVRFKYAVSWKGQVRARGEDEFELSPEIYESWFERYFDDMQATDALKAHECERSSGESARHMLSCFYGS
ncbi:MAG: hypothetical protein H6686_09005 [Fibrobacteria bacterium]|nr:hypothetical protein [Fibrobacteria bacterium]